MSLYLGQCWAIHLKIWFGVQHVRNLNVVIFLGTVNVINIKLYMKVLLIELYLFIPLSLTVAIFQGYSSAKQV